MADGATGRDEEQEEGAGGTANGDAAKRGNALEDASDEAVRFMEEGDEPGHAGRGDAG
jgi:hypothetical protein